MHQLFTDVLFVSVASLGLVSPGAATGGVTPIFPEKKNLFSHHLLSVSCVVSPLFVLKTDDLFLLIPITFIDFNRYVRPPPWRVSPP